MEYRQFGRSRTIHFPRLPRPVGDVLGFTAIGALIGAVYGHMIAVGDGHPFFGLAGLPRGTLTGVLIGGILISFERGLAQPAKAWLARAPFLVNLAIKTIVYLAIILFGLAVGARLFPTPAEAGCILSIAGRDVLFSFAAVLAIRFVDDVNHLLGQNVLLDFVTGRYHRPRLEERIFLFIDIEGSTALAERLGPLAFHRLVNRFVVDVTAPIVAAYGEIHRYVGDELIATWKLPIGIGEARIVRGCFAALDRLAALRPAYVREFGVAVNCRVGLHCGPVVAGEMGSVKKEIAVLGDTVNTAARILELCRQTGDRVLASATLVDRLELPPGVGKRSLGELRLRGRAGNVALYALEKHPAGEAAIAA